MIKSELKKIYDSYAPNYSQLIKKAGWWAPGLVKSILGPYLKEKSVVLDAGCADGYSSLEIFGSCDVYGFDHSPKMVEYAKNQPFKQVKLHDADDKFPYKNSFFDATIGLGFFEFIKNIHFTMSELKRVVKDGGFIFITVEDLDSSLQKQATKTQKVVYGVSKTRYSKKEMLRLFKKLKLNLIKDDRIFGYESESLKGKYYYHYYLLQKKR